MPRVILWDMQPLPLFDMMKRALLPAVCLLVMSYFGTHALFGPAGYFALDDIRREQADLSQRRAHLLEKRAVLSRDIALLDPRGADPDFADELVRRHLGVVRPDEVIVPLEKPALR